MAGTGGEGYSGDGGPATSAKLNSPYGMAVDSAGNLFIADMGNNRIRQVLRMVDPAPPTVSSASVPSAGTCYCPATMPALFSGSAADDSDGLGLSANSTTFTLKRNADSNYWNGGIWQSTAAWLATSHAATSDNTVVDWISAVTLPAWTDGDYTIQAKATDYEVYNFIGGAVTFTFDNIPPVVEVTRLMGGEFFRGESSENITWSAATDAHLADNPIGIEYYNGTAWISIATGEANDGVYTWTVLALDINTRVRVTASDRADNTGVSESSAFTIDSTPPEVSLTDIADNVSSLPYITGLASDPATGVIGKVQVALNNTSSGTF
ncbi:hypothetical protein ACFLXC_04185 [Chloroflexota bacterium]